jgi:hypothetical protein
MTNAKHTPEAEALADAILKAAGSGLRHYSLPKTREAIFAAAQQGIDAARAELLLVAAEAAEEFCTTRGYEDMEAGCCKSCRARATIAKARGEEGRVAA